MSFTSVHIYRFFLVLVISIGNVQCTPIVDGERVPDHGQLNGNFPSHAIQTDFLNLSYFR